MSAKTKEEILAKSLEYGEDQARGITGPIRREKTICSASHDFREGAKWMQQQNAALIAENTMLKENIAKLVSHAGYSEDIIKSLTTEPINTSS